MGDCICVRQGDGPEGCGICNETGTTPDIAGVIAELWDCADWSRPKQCKKISKAADTLERQAAEIERLRGAFGNIQIEAERKEGSWVHLKRVIAINARAALTGEGA